MALTPFDKYKQILVRESHNGIGDERRREFGKWLAHLWDYLSDKKRAIILNASWDRGAMKLDSNFCRCCFKGILADPSAYVWCVDCYEQHYESVCFGKTTAGEMFGAAAPYSTMWGSYCLFVAAGNIEILQAYLFKHFNVERVAPIVETTYTGPMAVETPITVAAEKPLCKQAYYGISCNCGSCPTKKNSRFTLR